MIQAINISIGYSQAKIVAANLNLIAKAGEFICLIGPNGGGKSTLLKTIAGLLPLLNGEIFINNKPFSKIKLEEKAKTVASVLTTKIQIENLDVYSAVATGRTPYTSLSGILSATDKNIIEETISITGLNGFENRFIETLSDGELQKVMIARALAQDCPVMLLDEPTAHLDIINKIEITQLLKKIAKEKNKSIILSTHDLNLALQTADKIWLMHNSAVYENSPQNMINSNSFTEAFSGNTYTFNKNTLSFQIN